MLISAITMQKNEGHLLDAWVTYHAAIFGSENVIVIDNGSTDEVTLSYLAKAKSLGVKVLNYDDPFDFERKGVIVSDVISSSLKDYDFCFPIDCDEFVVTLRDGQVDASYAAIQEEVEKVLSNGKVIARIKDAIWNIPGSSMAYVQSQYKVGVVPKAGIRLDLGFHLYDHAAQKELLDADLYYSGNLSLVHFHNRYLEDLLDKARAKLRLRVESFEDETLKNYRGTGSHLIRYFFMSEEQYYGGFGRGTIDLKPIFSARGIEVPFSSPIQ